MEFSSPLAAMRPQPYPAWGNRRDLPMSRSLYHGYPSYGPGSFDFKSMSMQTASKPPTKSDYFAIKPVRGSSPTSSLTADLDANFHIDKSPQAPTPRRSLFTANLFKSRDEDATPLVETEFAGATTPPIIPSSSPGIEAMDVSPLPHKMPYFNHRITLPSPSPDVTVDDGYSPDLLSTAASAPLLPVLPPTFLQLPERKRPVTRPTLSRSKGYSVPIIPQRPNSAETQLPPFQFGNVITHNLASSSTPSLLESFTQSPVEDLQIQPMSAMLPPPRRPSLTAGGRMTGSPSSGHVRKASAGKSGFVRPQRKIMRRSLSMFQHPDDVMREEQETFEHQTTLSSIMDVDQDNNNTPKLPHFTPDDEPDSLPRISQDTMADILNNKYSHQYDNVMVVDCRFEYEYSGGHIENAVNFNDKQHLANELFNTPVAGNTLLILHCEYSVHRAPMTAKYIRNHDRNVNAVNYPRLTFPEMYILDGGYSNFFEKHRSKCFPQNYVEMNDQRHEQACERGMAKVKQRQKLFRNQTFAFGQHDEMIEDSPTAPPGRSMGLRSQSTFEVGINIADGIGQTYTRRMASY